MRKVENKKFIYKTVLIYIHMYVSVTGLKLRENSI